MLRRHRLQQRINTSVTAAAQRIELTPDKQHELTFKRAEDWQIKAWEYYDGIGEAGYSANYMGNSIGRLRAFPGVRPDPQGDVEPLKDQPDADAGYSAAEVVQVRDALDRLKSPLGGRDDLQRRFGVNMFVAGDCFLIGMAAQGDETDESWEVYSSEQVRIDYNTTRTVRGMDGRPHEVPLITIRGPGQASQGKQLPPEAVAYRIWRPHPRYRQWPDSPFRRSMTILEELDVATRAIMGGLRSRLNGPGVWFLPQSLLNSGAVQAPNLDGDGQAQRTKGFVGDLIDTTASAINDPATAAARIPFIAGVQDHVWEKMDASKQLVQWDRTLDDQMAKTRAELIQRFATSIDLPPEILTGKADINHWGSWNIDEDTYKAHVQPFAATIFDALTMSYLWPTLRTMGIVEPERFVLWFDPTDLVADPDKQARSAEAHRNFLISDTVARQEIGYTDEDAPDDDEIARRVWIEAARAGRQPVTGPVPDDEEGMPQGPPPQLPPAPAQEPEQQAAATEPVAAIVASAKDRALLSLGGRLEMLDNGLLMVVHARADQVMRRALERANARLKTLALRALKPSALKSTVEALTPESLQVAPTLGESLIVQLAGQDDDGGAGLMAGAFTGYLEWWDERVGRTQDQAVNDIATAGDISDGALSQHVSELDEDRAQGRHLMLDALMVAAVALMLDPNEPSGPVGELGGSLLTYGAVRPPLARAGGGGEHAYSLLSGDRYAQVMADAMLEVSGWTWNYGDPASRHRPFLEHLQLNGFFFADWSNDELGNSTFGYPGVSHFAPGDHPGCQCSATPAIRRVPQSSTHARRGTSTVPA